MTDSSKKNIGEKAGSHGAILDERPPDGLDLCQKIKFMSAELHHFFAEVLMEERETLLFWKRTALEEENNAKEFALIAKLRRQNVVKSLTIDPLGAEITIIYLQTLLEKLKDSPPDPAEALRIAIKVEEKITPYHLNSIVTFSDPSFMKLFSSAILADQARIEVFRNALARLSGY